MWNKRNVKKALFAITALLVVAACVVPFFFSEPPWPIRPVTTSELERVGLKSQDIWDHLGLPDVAAHSVVGVVRGNYGFEDMIMEIPAKKLAPALIREDDMTPALQKYAVQHIDYIGALDKERITENRGWVINGDAKPRGEIVTSGDIAPATFLSYGFSVPRSGSYDIYVNLLHDDGRGTLSYRIDDHAWSQGYRPQTIFDINGDGVETVLLGTAFLDGGEHTLSFQNGKPFAKKGFQSIYWTAIVEVISERAEAAPLLNAEEVSANESVMEVTGATGPYIITATEDYDPSWSLRVDDEALAPESALAGLGMVWVVDKPGDYTMRMIKTPVVPWWGGLALALAVLVIMRTIIYVLCEDA